MKWAEIPAGDKTGAEQRFWVALGDSAGKVATTINTNPLFMDNVARFILNNLEFESKACTSLNPQWLKAREIMSKNFFGIEEAIKHLRVNPTKQQLAYLSEVPFSEEVLTSCKDTHILVAVFPLSILNIRNIVKKKEGQTLFYSQDWYDKEAFAKDKGKVGWQLVRKEHIANSASKTWNDQQALLSKDEETPTARIVIYTMIGYFLATGKRLFEKIYVRCVDLSSRGDRVYLGNFDSKGLNVDRWRGGGCSDKLNLSSARKQ